MIPRDGYVQIECRVGLLLFCPSKGTTLYGIVKDQNEEGITISLKFIDAFIPATLLMQESVYDSENECWVWKYDDDGTVYDLYYENDKDIKFKVFLTHESHNIQIIILPFFISIIWFRYTQLTSQRASMKARRLWSIVRMK